MVGGRIGEDGIHGATFSSAALDEAAPGPGRADRRPDHAEEDVRLPARGARPRPVRARSPTTARAGCPRRWARWRGEPGGARLDLAQAPLKYAGLAPVGDPALRGAGAHDAGRPAGEARRASSTWRAAARWRRPTWASSPTAGFFHVHVRRRDGRARLSMEFLHDGAPDLNLDARSGSPPCLRRAGVRRGGPRARRRVRGAHGPRSTWLGRGQGAPLRPRGEGAHGRQAVRRRARATCPPTPRCSSRDTGRCAGYVLSEGVNPFYSDIDTLRHGRAPCVDLAVRRQLCAGRAARPDRGARQLLLARSGRVRRRTPTARTRWRSSSAPAAASTTRRVAYGAPLISRQGLDEERLA